MRHVFFSIALFLFALTLSPLTLSPLGAAPRVADLASPDGRIVLRVGLDAKGAPFYAVRRDGEILVAPSTLGYELRDQAPLRDGFRILSMERRRIDEFWSPIWGERERIRNRAEELRMALVEEAAPGRRLDLVFQVHDDGVAFHYAIPAQAGADRIVILRELSRFRFVGDHACWWIPSNYDTYELLYRNTPLSMIGKAKQSSPAHTHSTGQKGFRGANTPMTMRCAGGTHVALHEARLVDYAGMTLVPDGDDPLCLVSELVPWPNGDKVRATLPMRSPWRTIQIGDDPGDLVESSLILNLNDPCALEDTSWIEPMKYVGIWWSMHLGITTWGKKGGRHGATTAETKRHIDFAAANGIRGVLVEGWNTGWESWYKDDNFDFHSQYDDFDLAEVTRYAAKHGVEIVGHHETGGQIESYEKNLERAFTLYREHGVRAVKTGYAGKIRPAGIYHHGQRMVRHYRHVLDAAARHRIMLDVHEPIKDTGLRRTFPHVMTREGVRGMEWNAWSRGNPPEHQVNLVFTRGLSGPMDYTPGIFDLTFERYAHQHSFWNAIDGLETKGRMHSTLARQLALYVVLYSPMQMAADLPENYDGHPAFQFIREVPVDWSESRVLSGVLGEHVVIARRGRGTHDWFIGAITDDEPRHAQVRLDMLDPKRSYLATFYRDGLLANYRSNPLPVTIERRMVKAGETLRIRMAPGGGQAITIRAVPRDHP